jgi:hypothetical protein
MSVARIEVEICEREARDQPAKVVLALRLRRVHVNPEADGAVQLARQVPA